MDGHEKHVLQTVRNQVKTDKYDVERRVGGEKADWLIWLYSQSSVKQSQSKD